MRRVFIPVSIVMVMLLGLLAVGRLGTTAQEGTPEASPAADPFALPAGVTIEVLGFGAVQDVPPPTFFEMLRVTMEPGASFAAPNDPAVSLLVIESGEAVFRIDSGPVFVVRDAAEAGFEAPMEEIAAGTEFTLGAGEGFVVPPFSTGEARNEGSEPVVWTIASIYPDLIEGTPEATPVS